MSKIIKIHIEKIIKNINELLQKEIETIINEHDEEIYNEIMNLSFIKNKKSKNIMIDLSSKS